MDLTHEAVSVEDMLGMYTRGVVDASPRGYFLDSLNVKFTESDVLTRDGSVVTIAHGGIVRFFMYKRLNETPRAIYLDNLGSLYDSLYPNVPIWTDPTFYDFSMVNFNNRAYITPHNRVTGIAGKHVLVYDGSGAARPAGGNAPSGFTLVAVESNTSGNVEAGLHLLAVSFVSSTGFMSMPGPAIYAQVTSTGKFAIDVSSIPIGPAGTVARQLVTTKAIQSYNGNQIGYQFYLIGSNNGGRINNNVETTTKVNFYDSELFTTVDHLFYTRAQIPAGVGIGAYRNRMIVWGIPTDEHSVYISKDGDPEQFDTLAGYKTFNPFDSASGVRNCFEFRGNLIVCKAKRIYATQDNGHEPTTWVTPDVVDAGAGTECFGVSAIIDARGQQNDRAYIADRAGLLIYEGYIRRPECSWLVENTWKRINKPYFNKIQVCVDTDTSSIYITLPLDSSTEISHILYGYYGTAYGDFGFEQKKIKWSLWQFYHGTKSICVDVDVNAITVLKYAGSAGNLYDMKSDNLIHDDAGHAYPSYVQTALYTVKPKWINHLALINLRLTGSGILTTELRGIDASNLMTLVPLTMTPTPGKERELKANFKNERVSAKFSTGANFGEYFVLSRFELYLKPIWMSRAA